MKTILTTIFLLIAGLGFGQRVISCDSIDYYFPPCPDLCVEENGDTVYVDCIWSAGTYTLVNYDYSFNYKVQQYIQDYEEYEAECWADSTFVTWYGSSCPTCLDIVKRTAWIHKEPNLPEFIEFLRRKYNQ